MSRPALAANKLKGMPDIVNPLRLFATALTFLSRMPVVARWSYADPEHLARSARYFPLVGVFAGAVGAAVYSAASLILPAQLAATLGVLVIIAFTGAFHEDGLADTMDGFGGAFEVQRKLEIMKDSRIGSYGATALVLALLLKVGALASLSPAQALPALLAAHALSRWSCLPLTLALPYVRAGSNKPMADALGCTELLIGSAWLLAILSLLLLLGWTAQHLVVVPLVAIFSTLVAGAYSRAQIGGITGDTLGASNQLVEISVLLSCVALA